VETESLSEFKPVYKLGAVTGTLDIMGGKVLDVSVWEHVTVGSSVKFNSSSSARNSASSASSAEDTCLVEESHFEA
jgi:hypothetical protein